MSRMARTLILLLCLVPLGCAVEASHSDKGASDSVENVSDGDVKAMLETLFMVTQLANEIEAFRIEEKKLPPGNDATALAREIAFIEDLMMDGWGRPMHYEPSADGKGYTIVSFGSDGTPERSTWSRRSETTDPAADVVFSDGRFVRSPRQFAFDRLGVGTDEKLTEFVEQAIERAMAKRTLDAMQSWGTALQAFLLDTPKGTEGSIEEVLAQVESSSYYLPQRNDAWGTPFLFELDGRQYRIVSAGSDRQFDDAGTEATPSDSYTSDAIYSDGDFVRRWPGSDLAYDFLESLLAEEMRMASLPSASPDRLKDIKVQRMERHIYGAEREGRTSDGVHLYIEAKRLDPSFSNRSVLRDLIEPVDPADQELADLVRKLAEEEGLPLPPQIQQESP